MCLLPDPFLSTFLLCFYYKGAEPCIQSVVRAGARQEDRGEESQDISLQLSALVATSPTAAVSPPWLQSPMDTVSSSVGGF